jgi:hypothetical protein
LRPRPRQKIVEQNNIGGDLLDLITLGLERALGRRYQEAYDKRSKRGEQSGAQPHYVSCVGVQMRLGQDRAKQQTEQRTSENEGKCNR